MLFTSYQFLCLLLLCFISYYLIPKKYQWILLLIVSYVFYFMAGSFFPVFIFATSITTYLTTRKMDTLKEVQQSYIAEHKDELSREDKRKYKKTLNSKRKRWMLLCLLFNFGILAVLKYTNFAIDNMNNGLSLFGSTKQLSYTDLIIPLGISFYTFKSIGYLLDIYWEKCRVQKNFFRYALFVSFFPQLIQGPISRYGELSNTLYQEHSFDWRNIRFGLERILWGYFKKLVIADRILMAVSMITEDPEYYTGAFVFVGMIFYGIELYADFTGGIDIAIGIGQVFGVKIAENFERPFFSKNIAEYWRRWHITMGTWFRDYVFYPMSISKPLKNLTSFTKKHFGKGAARRIPIYVATMVTWFATGIWHGASWNFIIWGLMNGLVILISQECNPLYEKFHKRFPKIGMTRGYRAFQIIRTFLLLCTLRLFDCYRDVKTAFRMFFSMFTDFNISQLTKEEFLDMNLTRADYIIVLIGVILLFVVSMVQRKGSVRECIATKPYIVRYLLFTSLLFAVILLGAYGIGYDATQFIYNQF